MLVRVWRHEQLRQETVLALNQRNGSDPSYPYYGVLEYDGTYNQSPDIVDTVSIELQPVQEHGRYWAFAIVIPWGYEGVTIVSPRP